jgi:hypothetical protein
VCYVCIFVQQKRERQCKVKAGENLQEGVLPKKVGKLALLDQEEYIFIKEYILCIEHPRQMCLSLESNPVPPVKQANTLCKEPFKLSSKYYSEPQLVLLQIPTKSRCKLFELGIMAEFDLDADIIDRTCRGPNSERGS